MSAPPLYSVKRRVPVKHMPHNQIRSMKLEIRKKFKKIPYCSKQKLGTHGFGDLNLGHWTLFRISPASPKPLRGGGCFGFFKHPQTTSKASSCSAAPNDKHIKHRDGEKQCIHAVKKTAVSRKDRP